MENQTDGALDSEFDFLCNPKSIFHRDEDGEWVLTMDIEGNTALFDARNLGKPGVEIIDGLEEGYREKGLTTVLANWVFSHRE